MARALIVSIRLYERRYHGAGEWPPAPARLFQALVAGTGLGGPLEDQDCRALAWIETLDHPLIAAPRVHDGHTVTQYVPNNDLDSVGGDPRRIAEIRLATKVFRPRLLDDSEPFKYVWMFKQIGDENHAAHTSVVCALAERLYQFGRGVDFACAWGEVVDDAQLEECLSSYPGTIHRPSSGGNGVLLKCPMPGSLKSLQDRYLDSGKRFHSELRGRVAKQTFTKASIPQFALIAYDSPSTLLVFDLRKIDDSESFAMWPLAGTGQLAEILRDGATSRLTSAMPVRRVGIENILVGRQTDATDKIPAAERVRIIPLPSIGHHYANRGIRRVLIEVPAGSSLHADDVQWAFSGLEPVDPESGESLGITVNLTADQSGAGMLPHYGIGDRDGHRRWRTVTPAALPDSAMRRRIDPDHKLDEAKSGQERAQESAKAGAAVVQALRYAGVSVRAEAIRVQREPFESNGERVETFAKGTRFSKHRLWHVEIEFARNVPGPLVIGDGRFLGLGLCAPMPKRDLSVS